MYELLCKIIRDINSDYLFAVKDSEKNLSVYFKVKMRVILVL